jgi:hypothetical protein
MMNDDTEQFEHDLSRAPLRKIPAAWRAEILAAARAAEPAPHAVRRVPQTWLATVSSQLATLLWPHPKAWAGLAAAWIVIFAMHFSTHEAGPVATAHSAPPSPEAMVELKKQQRLFAELVGSYEAPDTDRRKIFSPKPRSERTEIMMT